MSDTVPVASTRPPAKLNLFLELIEKRADGFHEIDTVMIPIDLCDKLSVWRIEDDAINLKVDWLPSKPIVAKRLGIELGSKKAAQLLQIPESESNLVHRALREFKNRFDLPGGFGCDLRKRIPAGAGMGGASSDAASALLCAAKLCDIPQTSGKLFDIAASIGSDVPFFLGAKGTSMQAARATGRGERINAIELGSELNFVLAYPNDSLSTAKVYEGSKIVDQPTTAEAMVVALATPNVAAIRDQLLNRLSDPAKKILPRIDEILESMWHSGLQACQLTGSGSACFAIADSQPQAQQCFARLQAMIEPGSFTAVAKSVSVPAPVVIANRK